MNPHRLRTLALVGSLALALPARAEQDPFAITPELSGQALFSAANLTIDGSSVVDSKGALGGSGASGQGHIVSNSDVVLNGAARVAGGAWYGPGRRLVLNGSATVSGTKAELATARNAMPIALAALATQLAARNDNASIGKTSKNRSPLQGSGGTDFVLNGNETLALPPGTYFFTKISVGGSSRLTLSGLTRILCTGPVTVNGSASVHAGGNPWLLRLWSSGSSVSLGGGSPVSGFLYAPSAAAAIDGGATLTGGLFAAKATVSGGARVTRSCDDATALAASVTNGGKALVDGSSHRAPVSPVVVVSGGIAPLTVAVRLDGAPFVAGTAVSTDGTHRLVVAADDLAGRHLEVAITFTIDRAGPRMAIVRPAPGEVVATSPIEVSGTCEDAVSVTVNGTSVPPAGGAFRAAGVVLAEGRNTMTVAGTDAAGNSTTVSSDVVLDSRAPAIALQSPADRTLTNAATVTVSGTVTDAHLVSFSVGGIPVPMPAVGGPFSQAVPLAEGPNEIAVEARDSVGHLSRLVVRVERDTTNPVVRIEESGVPLVADKTYSRELTITVTAVEAHPGSLMVVLDGSPFTSGSTVRAEGEHTISASATDAAGNSEATALRFRIDRTAPSIAITSPTPGGLVRSLPQALEGTCGDAVSVVANGVAVTPVDGRFSVSPFPFAEGPLTVTVSGTDAAGNAGSASAAFVVDTLEPVVVIQSPAEGEALGAAPFFVAGTATDANLLEVAVNGQQASLGPDGSFRAGPFTPADGAVVFTAQALDRASRRGLATRAVTVDTVPPEISIRNAATSAPIAPDEFFNAAVTLAVSVTDATTPSLTTYRATLDGGAFAGGVVAGEGAHRVEVTATDGAGNSAADSAAFSIDTVAPVFSALAPPQRSVIATSPVTLSGQVSADTELVTVGGRPATCAGGSFSLTGVPLAEGPNDLEIVARDRAGNRGTETLRLVLDTTKPVVAISSPAPGVLVDGLAVDVRGTASDPNLESVTVEGAAASVESDGRFVRAGVALLEGPNTLTATARDQAGNQATVSVTAVADSLAPTISITAPGAGAVLGQGPAVVSGTAIDAHLGGVTVNGVAASVDEAGRFSASVPLSEGNNTLTAEARDTLGHKASAAVAVSLDSAAPAVALLEPADGRRFRSSPVVVSGRLDSETNVESVTVNGVAAPLTGASFEASVPLLEGANTITARARKTTGKEGTAKIEVVLDTTPPSLTASSPADGQSGVSLTPEIRLTFSEALDAASVTPSAFSLAGSGTPAPAFSASLGGAGSNVVTLVPAQPLADSRSFELSGGAGLKDLAGNALAATVTLRFTTLDQTAPAAPVLEPLPALLCAESIAVKGTAEPGAAVSVTGGAAGAQGAAAADGRFAVTVPLAAGTTQTLAVVARDASGNASAAASATVTVDCVPPRVVDVARTAESVVVSFDEPIAAASVVAGQSVRLDGPGGAALAASARLAADGTSLSVSASGVDLAAAAFTLSLSSGLEDLAGNALAPFVRTFEPLTVATVLLGEAFDDAIGRPLAGATATLLVSGGVETPEPRPYATATASGAFALPSVAGDALVRIGAPGYLDVWRRESVVTGASAAAASATLFDARLTPVAGPAASQPTNGGTHFRATFGTRAVSLEAPAGSLPADAVVRLTLRRPQGLPVLLPLGWSVASAVRVSIASAAGAPVAPTGALSLALPDSYGATSATPLLLARLDPVSLQWTNEGSASLEGGVLRASIGAEGDWAVLVPDPSPTAPALSAPGAPLQGVSLPETDPLESATVVADPVDVLPSQPSDVSLTVSSPVPVPSGFPVQALVTEELTLLDGSRLAGPSFLADLVLLRRGDGSVGLTIPVRASEGARRVALSFGYERFAVKKFPFEVRRGVVVSASGGTVTGASGWAVTLAAGAVSGTTSVSLTPLGVAELPAALPSGFDFLGAVRLSTGGPGFSLPARLSLETAAAPPTGRDLLVVSFEDRGGFLLARPVARAAWDASSQAIRSMPIDRAAFPWPGILSEGVYAFLAAREPLAFAAGRVLDVDGASLRDTLVSVSGGWSLQAVTEGDGTFAVALRAATSTLSAVRVETGNRGQVTVAPAAPAQEITGVELRLAVTPPWVAGVTPAPGSTVLVGSSFTVTFSEAVDPLSLTPESFLLVATVDGRAVVVPARIAVDPSGFSATLLPATALPDRTPLALGVSRTVRDRNGYGLVDAITRAAADYSASYTTEDLTPPDAKPWLVRMGLPAGDPVPTVTIAGAPGAVCGGCHVVATNDTTLATASTDALSDGSFTLALAARATDAIRVVVEKPNGTKQTLPSVPFTNDGGRTVLVGAKGGAWETPEGFRVGVPASAFAGPVHVVTERVTPSDLQTLVAAPRDAALVDSFRMEFGTAASSGFDLSFAAPATSATDQFFLAQVVEVLGRRKLMVVDLLASRNGRLVTDRSGTLQSLKQQGFVALVDSSATAVRGVVRVDAQLLSVQGLAAPGSQIDDPKSFFDGVFEKGTYAVYNAAVRMATVAGTLGAGNTVATSSASDFVFDSTHALDRTYFRLLTPVGKPFDLSLVDRDSGLALFEGSYGGPTGAERVDLVNPPSADTNRPGVLVAGPVRIHRFDAPGAGMAPVAVAEGVTATGVASGEGIAVTLRLEASAGPKGASLHLVNFSRPGFGLGVATEPATTFSMDGARPGDALAFVPESIGVPIERSFIVRFDEQMARQGESWNRIVTIESRSTPGGASCPAVTHEVTERDSAGSGVQELAVGPGPFDVSGQRLPIAGSWLRPGCRYTLRIGTGAVDLAGNKLATEIRAEFTTGGESRAETIEAPAFIRKVLHHGGLLLATGEDQAIRVYDARLPGSIRASCDMQSSVAPTGAATDCPSGATTPHVPLPGVGRDLVVDRFGRLIVVGGGTSDTQGASPGLGFLRLYDFVRTCGNPTYDCGRRLAPRGTTVISAPVGGDTITYPPQGTPRRIALQEEVQERTWVVDSDDNANATPPSSGTTITLDLPMPECGGEARPAPVLAIRKSGSGGRQGYRGAYVITSQAAFPPSPRCHRRRFFSFTNLATGETVNARTDENGTGLYPLAGGEPGVRLTASSGDRIRMALNGASVAVVDVLGYGLALVDLDAVYDTSGAASDPPSAADPSLASKLLVAYEGRSRSSAPAGSPDVCRDGATTPAPKTCDEPWQRCAPELACELRASFENLAPAGYPAVWKYTVNDLLALTGIAIRRTDTPGVAWGFGTLNGLGLLSFSLDLRSAEPSGRPGLGLGRERTFPIGGGRTATIRNGHPIGLVNALPLDLPGASARANDVAVAVGIPRPVDASACSGWAADETRDLAFVAAGVNGVFVVDVSEPATPTVIGRFATRGGALAVAADARRKLLYVSDAGDGMKVLSFENPCGATPESTGPADDPRLVGAYAPSSGGIWNTPVSVDPDTGIVFGSETGSGVSAVTGFDQGVPPLYAVADTDRDGSFEVVEGLVPLGVENASKAAAIGRNPAQPLAGHGPYASDHFRVLAFIPGGAGETVDVEVAGVTAGGCDLPPSSTGFPRTSFRAPSSMDPASRPVVLRRQSDDPSDAAYNRYLSDVVTVLADPRALRAWERTTREKALPGEKGENDPLACRNCDVAKDLEASVLDAEGRRTELWSGDLVRVGYTDELRRKLPSLDRPDRPVDLRVASLSIPSVRGDLVPGLRQTPRESSSVGASDAMGVDLASGEQHLAGADLHLAGQGLDLDLVRGYSSQALHDGPLGRSWDAGFFARLRFLPDGDVDYYDGSARRETFRFDPGTRSLVPPPGLFVRLAHGQDGYWYLTHADKTVERFDFGGRLVETRDPASRTAQDGGDGNRIRHFHDGVGRLSAVLDTLGRQVSFEYYSAQEVAASGGALSSVGRLKKVTDHTGRSVEYRYDVFGRLEKALLPEVKTWAPGLGRELAGADGRPSATYVWEPAPAGDPRTSPRRWLLESDNVRGVVNGRRQETLGVTYSDVLEAGAREIATSQRIGSKPVAIDFERQADESVVARVTDRRGHIWRVEHAPAGHVKVVRLAENATSDANSAPSTAPPTGPVASGPFETTREYGAGADGLPTRIERPGKEAESRDYPTIRLQGDRRAAANVVRSTVTAAPPADAPAKSAPLSLTTTAAYDEATNALLELTEPGGLKTATEFFTDKGLPRSVTPPATLGVQLGPDGKPLEVGRKTYFDYYDDAKKGRLRTVRDPANISRRLEYFDEADPARGFVRRVLRLPGEEVEVTYDRRDARGNVLRATNARGVVTEYVVDEYDRVVEERRGVASEVADGGPRPWLTIQRAFDEDGNVESERLTDGATGRTKKVRNAWDALGRLVSRTENEGTPEERTTSWEYDSAGNLVVTTDPEGARTVVTYDARGLAVAVRREPAPGHGETPTTTVTFLRDARGNVIEEFDGVNTRRKFEYDGLGRLVKSTSPRGAATTTEYDEASRPWRLTTVSRDGKPLRKLENSYSPAGDVVVARETVFSEDGQEKATVETRAGYDGRRRVTEKVDPLGRITQWVYRDENHQADVIDAAGNSVTTTRDLNGNLVLIEAKEKLPGGGFETLVTTATWDALDRKDSETDPLGKKTRFEYDGFGRLVSRTDPEGVRTEFGYDLLDRLVRKVDDAAGLALETLTEFNRWDLPVALTDAGQALRSHELRLKTRYEYDGLGRSVKTSWADGRSRASFYNGDGTVSRTLDERGNETTFLYGPDDQVERAAVSRSAGTPGYTFEETRFDDLGRPVEWTTDGGIGGALHTTRRSYDSRGLVLSEQLDGLVSSHGYDLAGNRTTSAYPSPGRTLIRQFDSRNALSNLSDAGLSSGTPSLRATFDPWGASRTASIRRPSGIETRLSYDAGRRVSSMETRLGAVATPAHDLRYGWGDAGELLSETRPHEAGRADVFAYDRAYRMTAAGISQQPSGTPDTEGRNALVFGLGRVHTLDTVTRRLDGIATTSSSQTTARHQYTLFQGQARDHDLSGNETLGGGTRFEWDARNRLVRAVTSTGTTVEFGYDALGRRVERRQSTAGEVVGSRFVYDGFELVQEWACSRDCAGANSSYALSKEYLPTEAVDRPLEVVSHPANGPPEGSRFLLFGNLTGSIGLVTDDSGRPVERIRYLPHGQATFDLPVSVRSVVGAGPGALRVELAYAFDPATVNAANVVLLDRDGARIPAAASPDADGRTIEVAAAGLNDGTAVRLVLSSALTDRWGGSNGIDSTTAFTYRTSGSLFERNDFPLDRTSRVGLSRLWQGLEYDTALGLYYVRNRWYDPATGSFLSPDPLGFPDGLNQFTWPHANPWMQDPWGLAADCSRAENPELCRQFQAMSDRLAAERANYASVPAPPPAQPSLAERVRTSAARGVASGVGRVARAYENGRDASGEVGRDLSTLAVPPSTRPIDRDALRQYSELTGSASNAPSERLAAAQNGLSDASASVAEEAGKQGFDAIVAKGTGVAIGATGRAIGGPGRWARATESMSARAARYQAQISGRAAGEVYLVNGVKFDAFRDGVLLDAKGPGYGNFVRNGEFYDWFRGARSMREQAARQVAAAGSTPITWHVAEAKAVDPIRQALIDGGFGSRITVVHTPIVGAP